MSIAKKRTPNTIPNTPLGISFYSVKKEQTHYHDRMLELIYCINGNVTVTWSYETCPLSKGEILCIMSNEIHNMTAEDDNLMVSFYIDLNHSMFSGKNLEHFMLCITSDYKNTSREQKLKELINFLLSILYMYTENPETDEQTINQITSKLADIIFENFGVFYIKDEFTDLPWSKERFDHLQLYLNMHYKEKLTLKYLSEMEHLNANYLSIYFNKTFNDTFNNYMSVIRVFHSEFDLLTTDQTISTIAYNNGFSDPKFYYKAFKKWYGTTPNQHRKNNIKHNSECIPGRIYKNNEIRHIVQRYILYHFSKLTFDTFRITLPETLSTPKTKNYSEWKLF